MHHLTVHFIFTNSPHINQVNLKPVTEIAQNNKFLSTSVQIDPWLLLQTDETILAEDPHQLLCRTIMGFHAGIVGFVMAQMTNSSVTLPYCTVDVQRVDTILLLFF
jgi:hypothetical protein